MTIDIKTAIMIISIIVTSLGNYFNTTTEIAVLKEKSNTLEKRVDYGSSDSKSLAKVVVELDKNVVELTTIIKGIVEP